VGDNSLADNSIDVWDTHTWREVLTIPNHSPLPDFLAFALAPAQPALAVTDGSEFQLWDLTTGHMTAQWPTGNEHPNQLAVTPNGRILLAGNDDGTITEWDTVSHTAVRTFQGALSGVHALGISPDSTMVAAGGQDPLINIYSLSDGALIATLQGQKQRLNDLVFSPDGTHLLSTSGDGTAAWWNLDPAQAVRTLCQAVSGSSLDRSWDQLSRDVSASIGTPPC
jgi:WD40 repeat protein